MEDLVFKGARFRMNEDGFILFDGPVKAFTRIESEAIRDWLVEALKPRYTVEEKVQMGEVGQWEIIDNNCPGYRYPVELVTFKERKDFDAKAEARKLCKRLNEGEP